MISATKCLLAALLVIMVVALIGWIFRRQGSKARNSVRPDVTRSDEGDSPRPARQNYEDSCKTLQRLGYLDEGVVPPVPNHRPRYDDEEPLGVCFFRTKVTDGALDNLTLPRTYFGRSEVGPVSFTNTDLSESTLCWNDFNEVDFTDCDLSRSDLRASLFNSVKLVRAELRDADMRRSTFKGCDFSRASMRGTKLTNPQGAKLPLSEKQRREINWQLTDGEEPGGG